MVEYIILFNKMLLYLLHKNRISNVTSQTVTGEIYTRLML